MKIIWCVLFTLITLDVTLSKRKHRRAETLIDHSEDIGLKNQFNNRPELALASRKKKDWESLARTYDDDVEDDKDSDIDDLELQDGNLSQRKNQEERKSFKQFAQEYMDSLKNNKSRRTKSRLDDDGNKTTPFEKELGLIRANEARAARRKFPEKLINHEMSKRRKRDSKKSLNSKRKNIDAEAIRKLIENNERDAKSKRRTKTNPIIKEEETKENFVPLQRKDFVSNLDLAQENKDDAGKDSKVYNKKNNHKSHSNAKKKRVHSYDNNWLNFLDTERTDKQPKSEDYERSLDELPSAMAKRKNSHGKLINHEKAERKHRKKDKITQDAIMMLEKTNKKSKKYNYQDDLTTYKTNQKTFAQLANTTENKRKRKDELVKKYEEEFNKHEEERLQRLIQHEGQLKEKIEKLMKLENENILKQ